MVRLRRLDGGGGSGHQGAMFRFSSLLRPAFWLCLLAVYVLAILPHGAAPQVGNDKLQHMAAFFTLAALAVLALPKLSPLWIGTGLALFGALIEITQMVPELHRDASLMDWLADTAAIAFGLLVAMPFRRRLLEER